jgi:hypothetical protein
MTCESDSNATMVKHQPNGDSSGQGHYLVCRRRQRVVQRRGVGGGEARSCRAKPPVLRSSTRVHMLHDLVATIVHDGSSDDVQQR